VSIVLDASAILAFVQDDAGADMVEAALDGDDDARCGAANWSEVAQKVLGAGRDWDLVRALLVSRRRSRRRVGRKSVAAR